MKKIKMDKVDTAQQKQIDWLIFRFGLVSILLIIWNACLTGAILNLSK